MIIIPIKTIGDCMPFFGLNTHIAFTMSLCLFDKYFLSVLFFILKRHQEDQIRRTDAYLDVQDVQDLRRAAEEIFSFNWPHQEGFSFLHQRRSKWGDLKFQETLETSVTPNLNRT